MRLIWFRNKAPVAASSVPQCVSWRESVDTISTIVVDVKPVKKPPIHELHQNCGKLVKPWLLLLKHLLLKKFQRFERLHYVVHVLYILFTHVGFLAMAYFDKFRICKLWSLCSKVFRLLYLCIRPNFYTTWFLYTIACLTSYPQDMCVATAAHWPQACRLSLCSFPAPNPALLMSIKKVVPYKNWVVQKLGRMKNGQSPCIHVIGHYCSYGNLFNEFSLNSGILSSGVNEV